MPHAPRRSGQKAIASKTTPQISQPQAQPGRLRVDPGHDAAEILVGHRDHPREEVAQVVGQLAVVARHDQLQVEADVRAGGVRLVQLNGHDIRSRDKERGADARRDPRRLVGACYLSYSFWNEYLK